MNLLGIPPPPEGFIPEMMQSTAEFVAKLTAVRQRSEMAVAQAESSVIPKEKLN